LFTPSETNAVIQSGVSVLSLPAKWTPKNIVKEDDPNAETDTEEKEGW